MLSECTQSNRRRHPGQYQIHVILVHRKPEAQRSCCVGHGMLDVDSTVSAPITHLPTYLPIGLSFVQLAKYLAKYTIWQVPSPPGLLWKAFDTVSHPMMEQVSFLLHAVIPSQWVSVILTFLRGHRSSCRKD